MVDALEAAVYYREFLIDLLKLVDSPSIMPISCRTDNKAVFNAVNSSTQILDKRLRIETAILRELIETKGMSITWVPTQAQVADSLTKSGVPSTKILEHLSCSRTHLP